MYEIFMTPVMDKPLWAWALFMGIVAALLVFDLGVLNRKDHEIGYKESIKLSLLYVLLASLFGAWIWYDSGQQNGLDYFTGYLIEKSLSIDNVFVMSVIFAYFKVPRMYQHRVLFWGILGAVVMRGVMIALGAALVHKFEWILLIFGLFLIFTGIKLLLMHDKEEADEEKAEGNKIARFLENHLRFTKEFHGHAFTVRQIDPATGKSLLYATPLLLALIAIEIADVIFAVDSVPAIFAITTDPYIVFTSNIFAILGLRALYFLLAAMVDQFRYLSHAVSVVLIFIGGKVFYAYFFGKVDSMLSLGITLGVLAGGLVLSMIHKPKNG